MQQGFVAMICRTLIVSLMFLSFHSTAGMIGTDKVAVAPEQSDRAQIQNVLSRAEISKQLQSLGVDVKMAQDRVAVMSDEEARSLAGKLQSIPAGADSGAVIVVIIIVALLAWWWWARR